MGLLQLNPPIPVWVAERGTGYAIGWNNISQEHHLLWLIAFDNDSTVWEIPNPQVRLQKNFSMGRLVK